MPSRVEQLRSIDAEAARVRMNAQRLRKRCIDAGIAVRWGGTDRRPWLKVHPEDVDRILLDQLHYPPEPEPEPAKPGKKRQVRHSKEKPNPLVTC